MAGQHVVFMNVAASGHVNPTIALVAELRSRSCQVSYFGDALLKETVEGAGATWYPFRYPYGDQTGTLRNLDEAAIAKYVPDGTPEEEYKEGIGTAMIYTAEVTLPALVQDLQNLEPRPSLIVYDPFIASALVAAHVLRTPAVCLLTMPGPGVMRKLESEICSSEAAVRLSPS